MKEIVQNIVEIIKDYRQDDDLVIDENHVLRWVNQFEQNDQEFLLSELLHILLQSYFSKEKILNCLFDTIGVLAKKYKFTSDAAFLSNTYFIESQAEEKSQTEILSLFFAALPHKYGIGKKHLGKNSKKYIIYFDDVLATGKTTFRECEKWLNNISRQAEPYHKLLEKRTFDFIVYNLCCHTWGCSNIEYQFKQKFSNDVMKTINYYSSFWVENHITAYNQNFNCVYPININIQEVNNYFNSIQTGGYDKFEDKAFRQKNKPKVERFFSSPENRIRYENILLRKGIEILGKVQNLKATNIRPLGYTVNSHKTFGLGTQFFTFRNVSNTTPLVFWWENHGWYPLFPVKNRGQN